MRAKSGDSRWEVGPGRTGAARGRLNLALVAGGLVFLVLVAATFEWHTPAGDGEERVVEIPEGVYGNEITSILHHEGIINSPFLFDLWLRLGGSEASIQAGSYLLGPGMSPREVGTKLVQGKVVDDQVRVTIPEGYTVRQMARLLEERGLLAQDAFLDAAREAAGTRDYLPDENPKDGFAVEGYLFPDTFNFSPQESATAMIERMLDRFEEKIIPLWRSRSAGVDLDLHQALTLASIIERETGLPEERPVVSSVFHNRLRENMRLQSCATVQYLLDEPRADLTHQDLGINSPYNTYRHEGLPPGPIAAVGAQALRAAMEPEETEYLYFVADGQGSHNFSTTFREHLEARDHKSREASGG